LIRFIKHLSHSKLERFKKSVPAHSCVVESFSSIESQLYPVRTDKCFSFPRDHAWNSDFADEIVEFIMSVHNRRTSNTTMFSEDYTVAKFFSDMLRIQTGRFTNESDTGELVQVNYKLLESAYSKYVLEGVVA